MVVSFVLFDANSVGEAAAAIGGLFGAAGVSAVNPISLYYLRSFAVVFLIGIVGATPLPKRIVEQLGSTRAGAMVVDVLEPLVLVSVLASRPAILWTAHSIRSCISASKGVRG